MNTEQKADLFASQFNIEILIIGYNEEPLANTEWEQEMKVCIERFINTFQQLPAVGLLLEGVQGLDPLRIDEIVFNPLTMRLAVTLNCY